MRLEYLLISIIIFVVILAAVISFGSGIIPGFEQAIGNFTSIFG